MYLGHDTELAIAVLVDLINTGPETGDSERLPDLDALRVFTAAHHLSELGPLDEDDLAAVHEIRGRFRRLFETSSDEQAVAELNALLGDSTATPRLTNHDGYDWHLHHFVPGASIRDHLAIEGGLALARVISEGARERLRVCEAPDCARVLLDVTKNNCRRYCDSRTCGNRLHVAAYRARQRAAV
ncbi:MAG TPA: CGNR zinc finger domain-containing protein [Actinomycetes bacterium]|nr:CGNR zinc finger domain-containing protein [Actinomycetes bacterium]